VKRDLVLGGLLVALLLAVTLLTARTAEKTPLASHASGDFGFGGYRAWYDVLAREGVDVRRFRRDHAALAGAGIDTLVVAFPAAGLPSTWHAADAAAVHAWIARGGKLVDIGETPRTKRDDDASAQVFLKDTAGSHSPLRGPWTRAVAALDERGTSRLDIKPHARVETLLADGAGPLVVRYREGKGEVVGVADPRPFENRSLAHADAARLAYLVAQPRHAGGAVAFDETIRAEAAGKPWYLALTAPELLALALAALAGLLWLAYGLVPLGPPVRLFAPREPTSAEFLDAVAALYGRAGARAHARDALVADARRTLERAPRTAENDALAVRIAGAARTAPPDDAALVAVAQLARLAREDSVRAHNPDRRRAALTGGAGARRRRR
jgi:Domain of unknown function (DUF4350)